MHIYINVYYGYQWKKKVNGLCIGSVFQAKAMSVCGELGTLRRAWLQKCGWQAFTRGGVRPGSVTALEFIRGCWYWESCHKRSFKFIQPFAVIVIRRSRAERGERKREHVCVWRTSCRAQLKGAATRGERMVRFLDEIEKGLGERGWGGELRIKDGWYVEGEIWCNSGVPSD